MLAGVVQAGAGSGQQDLQRLVALSNRVQGMQQVLLGLAARLQQPPVTLLCNTSSLHSMVAVYTDLQQAVANLDPAAVQSMAAAVASGGAAEPMADMASSQPSRTLRVTNHPLPLTKREALAVDTFLSVLAAIFCMIPFCYLAGAYCVSPVNEARSGSRQLQVSSGCPRGVYWAGSLSWDLAMHAAVSVVSLATFAAFGDAATTGSISQALSTLLLLFGFGMGCIPLSYSMSLGFLSPSSAQVSISAICFVLGFMFVVGSETMKGIPQCQEFQRVAVHFCRLLPPFNLGEGLISLSKYHLYRMLAHDLAPVSGSNNRRQGVDSLIPADAIPEHEVPTSPFQWSMVGRNLCALYGTSLAYFLLTWGLDTYRNDAYVARAMHAAMQQLWANVKARTMAGMAAVLRTLGFRAMAARLAPRRTFMPLPESSEGDVELAAAPGQVLFLRGRRRGTTVQGAVSSPGIASPAGVAGAEEDAAAGEGLLHTSAGASSVMAGAQGEDDEDVAAERARVCSGQERPQPGRPPDVLSIRHLNKVYRTQPPKVAVRDLSLGVAPGERFGFLGANGAGKSSTLKILGGQAAPTGGDALVCGASVVSAQGAAAAQQRLVGYCPQVDPLLEPLSAWEQLRMFAALKGVPDSQLRPQVEGLLARVGLPASMWQRASGTLSGGNKRKLALAIALVGRPALVLLDEPSSGMDPGARRMMWDAILRATQQEEQGQGAEDCSGLLQPSRRHGGGGGSAALLLTTHYLEEAEALCDRVAIMSQGRMLCLGSPHHLKARFGAAYAIELRCAVELPAPADSSVAGSPAIPTMPLADAQLDSTAAQRASVFSLNDGEHAGLVTNGYGDGDSSSSSGSLGGSRRSSGPSSQPPHHAGGGSGSGAGLLRAKPSGSMTLLGIEVQPGGVVVGISDVQPAELGAAQLPSCQEAVGQGLSLEQRQGVLVSELQARLPGLQVLELGWGRVRAALSLGPNTPPLHHIFKVLEACKARPELGLLSYSVCQPSLESVFLTVCGHQLDDQGEYQR